MTYVHLLTETEKDSLIGQWYAPDSYFNPIYDFYDRPIISTQEADYCINPDFLWVKDLPLIEYVPKENPFPPIEE
jgi:hypothetical protein